LNTFKDRLQKGDILYGPFWKINSQALVEVAAYSGWDFAIFDMEHATYHPEAVENLVRAAENGGLGSVIRVANNDENAIVKAVDTGANCILVPHTSSKKEAISVVNAGKFYPIGQRGMDVYARSAKYGYIQKDIYLKKANKKTTVAIQVEGLEGVKSLPEIVKVEGLDLIFIGPYDLSESMGIPGQTSHPKVINKVEELVKQIKKAGKFVGIYVDTVEEAHHWADLGVQFISFLVDIQIFYQASCTLVNQLKKK